MKDFINFYYGITVDDIVNTNDYYYFKIGNEEYYFIPFNQGDKRLEQYINISNLLAKYQLKSHLIINNKDNKYITSIDDVNYILLKIISKNEEVNIIDINNYQEKIKKENILPNKDYISWSELWKMKIDYLENALKDLKLDNIVKHSVDYYIGLGELAILYYEQTISQFYYHNYPLTWSHRRLYYPNMSINYLNPVNYLYDYDMRDIAEYLKMAFFKDEKDFNNEFNTFIKITKFNNFNTNIFFARLLYPSYYFDILEKWINNKCSSDEMLLFIKKQDQFEQLLKKAYQILSKYALMVHADFLILKR